MLIRKLFLAVHSCALVLALSHAVFAEQDTLRWSYNDYGGIGLLQTRTARMADDGRLVLGYSQFAPHTAYYTTFQALPWLETTFRYDIFDGGLGEDELFDRSFDAKIRLHQESRFFPEISVGFQDLLGTGVFSGEYLVASRRVYDFDFSLGIGWGRSGSRNDFGNPLSIFSSRFDVRGAETGLGGRFRLGDFFSGPNSALFGGVEYITPIEGLRLKVEFNGDAFLDEKRLVGGFELNSRFNFGIEYRPLPWITLATAFEQGDIVMLRATLGGNAKTPNAFPKTVASIPALRRHAAADRLDKAREADSNRATPDDGTGAGERASIAAFFDGLDHAGIEIDELRHTGSKLQILVAPDGSPGHLERTRRIIENLALRLPLPINAIEVALAKTRPAKPGPGRVELTAAPPITPKLRAAAATGRPHPTVTPPVPKPVPQLTLANKVVTARARTVPTRQEILTALLRVDLKAVDLDLYALKLKEREIIVYFENTRYRIPAIAIGRGIRVVANALPQTIEVITVVLWNNGMETARLSLMRKDVENALANTGSSQEIWQNLRAYSTTGDVAEGASRPKGVYPKFEWSIKPALRQSLFDPNDPYLYQIWVKTSASVRLFRGLELTGALGFNIHNTFLNSERRSRSVLPHVRSDVNRYVQEGGNGMENLRLNYFLNIAPQWYGRLTAGYLEEMYAGITGEILYRPFDSRIAMGLDVNRVRQRAFNKGLGLRDYKVVTGHLSLYYDTPLHDYLATIRAGRYLAKDWGVTFQLARRFNSGIRVGGFATFTDVPFEDFGEGSFDKGIFVTVPLDIFFTRHTKLRSGVLLRPLTRDGGQRVASGRELYELTNDDRLDNIRRNWVKIFD